MVVHPWAISAFLNGGAGTVQLAREYQRHYPRPDPGADHICSYGFGLGPSEQIAVILERIAVILDI